MSIHYMRQVWTSDLPRPEKLVCLAIADHINDNGPGCFASYERLAYETSYEVRQVIRIVSKLAQAGIIVHCGEHPGCHTNIWDIDLGKLPQLPEFKAWKKARRTAPTIELQDDYMEVSVSSEATWQDAPGYQDGTPLESDACASVTSTPAPMTFGAVSMTFCAAPMTFGAVEGCEMSPYPDSENQTYNPEPNHTAASDTSPGQLLSSPLTDQDRTLPRAAPVQEGSASGQPPSSPRVDQNPTLSGTTPVRERMPIRQPTRPPGADQNPPVFKTTLGQDGGPAGQQRSPGPHSNPALPRAAHMRYGVPDDAKARERPETDLQRKIAALCNARYLSAGMKAKLASTKTTSHGNQLPQEYPSPEDEWRAYPAWFNEYLELCAKRIREESGRPPGREMLIKFVRNYGRYGTGWLDFKMRKRRIEPDPDRYQCTIGDGLIDGNALFDAIIAAEREQRNAHERP